MPEFPQDVVERVRNSVDIVQVVGESVRLEKRGKDFWGLCPFHSEKTPSFSVSQEKQMYYCFGCQAGGNSLSFLMEHNKMPFLEALENLAERAGIELPTQQLEDKDVKERRRVRERELKVMNWAAEVFHRQLMNESLGKEARGYLQRRGLSPELVESLKVGYSLPGWTTLLDRALAAGMSQDELLKVGLAVQGDKGVYDRFRHRVMFPIRNRQGQVIAFGGRVLDDTQPKYLNSPESSLFSKGRELFGLDRAARAIGQAGYALVVEGYMDAITAWQYGIDNVVASLGTALSSDHALILKRYTSKVSLCYDSDAVGQNAALRGMEVLRKAGLTVNVVQVEQGKDPDEYLRKFGKDRFLTLVNEQALPLVEYRILQCSKEHDLSTPQGLGDFATAAAKVLAAVENAVEREAYTRKVIKQYRLPEESFLAELAKIPGATGFTDKLSKGRNNISDRGTLGVTTGWVKASRMVLRIMAKLPEKRELLLELWSQFGFIDEKYRHLAQWMARDLTSGDDPMSFAHELSPELKSELAAAYTGDNLEENPMDMANECFIKIEEHSLTLQIERLQQELQSAEPEKRSEVLSKLSELQRRKKIPQREKVSQLRGYRP